MLAIVNNLKDAILGGVESVIRIIKKKIKINDVQKFFLKWLSHRKLLCGYCSDTEMLLLSPFPS